MAIHMPIYSLTNEHDVVVASVTDAARREILTEAREYGYVTQQCADGTHAVHPTRPSFSLLRPIITA